MDEGQAKVVPFAHSFDELLGRATPGGGFADRPGGSYRSDATAWTILALDRAGRGGPVLEKARTRLSQDQMEDGRLTISRQHPDAFWPTSLAALAWSGVPAHEKSRNRAVHFLLETTGRHFPTEKNSPVSHDTALRGWPWIDATHSWVEPTALAIIALDTCGFRDHDRVHEASRLLLNRQLAHGGWNYGNTTVFGQQLHPNLESTGAALHALEGRVSRSEIQRSLDYLVVRVQNLQTPLALGWSLLGLRSWGLLPSNALRLVERCLSRQERFGPYETTALCLLLCAASSARGLYPEV
jgi:hypothetical protein